VPSSSPARPSALAILAALAGLSALALVAAAVTIGANLARANPPPADGVFPIAAELSAPRPDALEVAGRRGPVWIVPGPALTPSRVLVYARDNANTAFALDVRTARASAACERGLLVLGGHPVLSESWGGDSRECSLDFELDAPTAARAAAAFHTTRQDRAPLGAHVVSRFTATRARYARGAPVEIVLRLESPPGSPTVGWQRGGSNRGPRDNQFSFTITRDGQPVPLLDAMDFGGLSMFEQLPAGAHAEVRTELAPWADLSRPGHYVVECRYETTLVPGGVDPYTDTTRGQVWDAAFTGQVTFDVR
jgi:hypothetical protein